MNTEYLIKMANQIGTFFESQPCYEQAQSDLARHIQNNWEPRMRTALLAHVDQHQGEGLSEFVRQTIDGHRQLLG